MKKLLLLLFLPFIAVACSSTKQVTDEQGNTYRVYTNYFAKNKIVPEDQMAFFASRDLEAFHLYFGPAATMSKQEWITPDVIDPHGLIIGVIDEVTNDTSSIAIRKIRGKGDVLYVDYTVKKSEPRKFKSRVVAVALTNGEGVKKVVFRDDSGKENEVFLK